MSYPSVDALQKLLVRDVFHYAKDGKKAAGRALGTLVEILTYYLLRSWGLRDQLAIERPLTEFANAEISHNVEFSLHPLLSLDKHRAEVPRLPISAAKIRTACADASSSSSWKNGQLLSADGLVRNSCVLADTRSTLVVAHLDSWAAPECQFSVATLHPHPFAIFECKRVGVEEGMRKGPQTIEKAKQGAYVARSISSLQKVRMHDGQLGGVIATKEGHWECRPYVEMLKEVIASESSDQLRDFVLTVGVVSNHGNWFTAENQNKELKVLAQAYDWLLFLTDKGLSEFINELLLNPKPQNEAASKAFLASYTGVKQGNRFTKVLMDASSDKVLQRFFLDNAQRVASWFNVITPSEGSLELLRSELDVLAKKDWKRILAS